MGANIETLFSKIDKKSSTLFVIVVYIYSHNEDTIATTIHKILERDPSFYVKQRTTEKVQFLFFSSFLLILTISSFWEENWTLGYNSMKF